MLHKVQSFVISMAVIVVIVVIAIEAIKPYLPLIAVAVGVIAICTVVYLLVRTLSQRRRFF